MRRWIIVVPLLASAVALPFVMVWLNDAGRSETVGSDVASAAAALAVPVAAGYFSNRNSATGEPPDFGERLLRVGAVAGVAVACIILLAVFL